MFVAVYPPSPSRALTAALLEIGAAPVPIQGVEDARDRRPDEGWGATIVEVAAEPGDALAVARKIRDEEAVPVLLVVDRTSTGDLVGEHGFDDFLLTPVDHEELKVRLARIDVSETSLDLDPVLRHRDLELNTETYQATIAGEPRDLTFMEYELLRFFVEHPRKVWSREQILSKVWGYDYFGGSRTVDVHVRRLRAKLGEERAAWITTVRSVGYRFG
jgi:DNA-binding response OmpR family regulator